MGYCVHYRIGNQRSFIWYKTLEFNSKHLVLNKLAELKGMGYREAFITNFEERSPKEFDGKDVRALELKEKTK